MNRRPVIGYLLFLALSFTVIYSFGCSVKAEEQKSSSSKTGQDNTLYILNSEKDAQGMKAMLETDDFRKIDEQWNHIHRARDYEKSNKYDLAEIEFKKAIEADKSDQGVSRRGLARIYEASGKYEQALEQINWLLERTSRPDVKADLLTRKQTLEKRLTDQT